MGGIKVGGKTYKVELKYYDDETKPERTAQLIEKLINEDKVNLIARALRLLARRARPLRWPRGTRSRWSRPTARPKASSRRATGTPS